MLVGSANAIVERAWGRRICRKALAALDQVEGVQRIRSLYVIALGKAGYAVHDPTEATPGSTWLWVSYFDRDFRYLSTGGV